MDWLLSIYIEDLNQKRVLLSQIKIQAKTLSLYSDLKTIDEIESGCDGICEIKNKFEFKMNL